MYSYKMFQSGLDLLEFINTYAGGSPMPQTSIVSMGFDPGNGRYFIYYVA